MSKSFFSVRLNIKEIEKNVLTKGNNLRFFLQSFKFSDSLSDFSRPKFLQYWFCICENPWNQAFSSTKWKRFILKIDIWESPFCFSTHKPTHYSCSSSINSRIMLTLYPTISIVIALFNLSCILILFLFDLNISTQHCSLHSTIQHIEGILPIIITNFLNTENKAREMQWLNNKVTLLP